MRTHVSRRPLRQEEHPSSWSRYLRIKYSSLSLNGLEIDSTSRLEKRTRGGERDEYAWCVMSVSSKMGDFSATYCRVMAFDHAQILSAQENFLRTRPIKRTLSSAAPQGQSFHKTRSSMAFVIRQLKRLIARIFRKKKVQKLQKKDISGPVSLKTAMKSQSVSRGQTFVN